MVTKRFAFMFCCFFFGYRTLFRENLLLSLSLARHRSAFVRVVRRVWINWVNAVYCMNYTRYGAGERDTIPSRIEIFITSELCVVTKRIYSGFFPAAATTDFGTFWALFCFSHRTNELTLAWMNFPTREKRKERTRGRRKKMWTQSLSIGGAYAFSLEL